MMDMSCHGYPNLGASHAMQIYITEDEVCRILNELRLEFVIFSHKLGSGGVWVYFKLTKFYDVEIHFCGFEDGKAWAAICLEEKNRYSKYYTSRSLKRALKRYVSQIN